MTLTERIAVSAALLAVACGSSSEDRTDAARSVRSSLASQGAEPLVTGHADFTRLNAQGNPVFFR